MSRYWSDIVHQLTPYVPGEQPRIDGLVKLNTNECPYPPSPAVLAAIVAESGDKLRLYPDPMSHDFVAEVARYHGLNEDQVFVGNGSDEVLAHVFMALLRHPAPLLFPDVSYSFYPVYAKLYGIEARKIPLAEDFSLRIDDYLKAGPNGGIIFPNPNAPTGMEVPLSELKRLLAANTGSVVVVDEAYIDFGGESAVSLIAEHPQLLVIRTLSKSRALAGLRVGYALGHRDLIEALARVKDSFNSYPLDRLAIVGATAAMRDVEWFERTRQQVIATRERMVAGLRARGFEVLPSTANFVFARRPGHEGAELAAGLREHKVLVRHFRQPERISPFLRISVGTEAQTDALLTALDAILA